MKETYALLCRKRWHQKSPSLRSPLSGLWLSICREFSCNRSLRREWRGRSSFSNSSTEKIVNPCGMENRTGVQREKWWNAIRGHREGSISQHSMRSYIQWQVEAQSNNPLHRCSHLNKITRLWSSTTRRSQSHPNTRLKPTPPIRKRKRIEVMDKPKLEAI